ncbi:MAG: F420-0--gamma-glutamyl ligase [Chloroflexi bacterium]|nr:F420-0--gamma-glutamyl ligase [Chloroflexota bacterium]
MERYTGTTARGIRTPIIRQGDDLVRIAADSIMQAAAAEGWQLHDRDVVAVTEAVVGRSQGNYATLDQIAADISARFPQGEVGVLFPILSRNRFAMLLRGIARGVKRVVLQLSYPADEVGNALVSQDKLEDSPVDPWRDVLTEARYRELFGVNPHPFTGVDYVAHYRELIEAEGAHAEIILANNPRQILRHTPYVLYCDIHTRRRTQRILAEAGAVTLYGLADILCAPIKGSGYNERYGLLGSNKADDERVKLFPRDCQPLVEALQAELRERTGAHVEVMIYGDGAFRDPVAMIWELADPVVSPAYTAGLEGVPNEVKLKYLADNDFKHLDGQELVDAIRAYIASKPANLVGVMAAEGTTPRRLTDLLGSLADLTSGSGDKGTPVVVIQGYFSNLAD